MCSLKKVTVYLDCMLEPPLEASFACFLQYHTWCGLRDWISLCFNNCSSLGLSNNAVQVHSSREFGQNPKTTSRNGWTCHVSPAFPLNIILYCNSAFENIQWRTLGESPFGSNKVIILQLQEKNMTLEKLRIILGLV